MDPIAEMLLLLFSVPQLVLGLGSNSQNTVPVSASLDLTDGAIHNIIS